MKCKSMTRFGMKLALGQIKGPKRILALDVGSLNTGVAVSSPDLKQSYLLKVIKCPSDSPTFFRKLRLLINSQKDLKGIIIGKPSHHNPEDKMLVRIQQLSKSLESSVAGEKQLMYCFEDENWTTQQAQHKIKQFKQAIRYHGHLHNQKELEDGIAAIKIMERFLLYYNQN